MKSVFILHHSYELEHCVEETKLIGVYSSNEEARAAIDRLKHKPGFCDRIDSFMIEEYELNKDHWTEGFVSLTNIEVKDNKGEWKTVIAEVLIEGNYRIIEKDENHLLGVFKNDDVVRCEEKDGVLYAVEKINYAS